MGLESATYISGLNSSNPVTADQKTEGDDHIRLIKSTLLATFPNITGSVTATHTELSRLAGGGAGVAFSAYLGGVGQSSGNTILFDTERYDSHSAYATGTGIFTAPYTGYYIFTASLTVTNTTGAAHTPYISLIHSSGYSYGYSGCYAPTGQNAILAVSAMVFMAAAETMKVSFSTEAAGSLSGTMTAPPLTGSSFAARALP